MTIIDAIIRREGGYVDHPADRGGATKYGITLKTLESWRGEPVTAEDVRDLDQSEARRIYERLYIQGPGFDRIAGRRLRELAVDCAVNHGPSQAARWLQAAAGVKADGIFGPKSLAAINEANETASFKSVLASRCRFYGRLIASDPSQAAFAAGWTTRLAEFIEQAA